MRRNAAHIDSHADAAGDDGDARGTEVSDRIWGTLHLGTIALERGFHTLSLRADRIAGRQVMDLNTLTLPGRD